jgi:hypothetical protein
LRQHYGNSQNAAQLRPWTVEQIEYRPKRPKTQGGKQAFSGYIWQTASSSIY